MFSWDFRDFFFPLLYAEVCEIADAARLTFTEKSLGLAFTQMCLICLQLVLSISFFWKCRLRSYVVYNRLLIEEIINIHCFLVNLTCLHLFL